MYTVLYYMSGKLETFTGMELLTAQSIILLLIIFAIFSMLVSALAIVVASKSTEEYTKLILIMDTHSPDKVRVNVW